MKLINDLCVLLQINRALLDTVVPELRAVIYDFNFEKMEYYLDFVYDVEINDRLFDITSVATTEIDLPINYGEGLPITVKMPNPIPFRTKCAYLRYEPNLPKIPKIQFPPRKEPTVPDAYLQALMNQALLGRVTPNLRLVSIDINETEKFLSIRFVYNHEISDLENQLAKAAFEEGTSSYLDYKKELLITRVDFPEKPPRHGTRYAYHRKEIEW